MASLILANAPSMSNNLSIRTFAESLPVAGRRTSVGSVDFINTKKAPYLFGLRRVHRRKYLDLCVVPKPRRYEVIVTVA